MQDSEWLPPVTKRKVILIVEQRKRKNEDGLHECTNTVDSTLPISSRFGSPTSEEQLGIVAKGVVPNNTLSNTHWAENNFLSWAVECNRMCPEDPSHWIYSRVMMQN